MKSSVVLLLLLVASFAVGQSSTNSLTVSGGTSSTCTGPSPSAAAGACVVIQNPNNFTAIGLEEIPKGGLSAASITAQGCFRGGTCDAASNTNTSTSAATIGITFGKVYDFFLVSGTFSGGTAPSFTINAHVGYLPASGSAASVAITSPVDGSGYVNIDCKTGCAGANPNGQATMANSAPVVIASNQSAVPVSGTFFQTTQPVSLATAPTTPVTGTFWQATQPVSLATAPTTPVTGTFWQTTQPISGPNTNGSAVSANSAPVVIASDQGAVAGNVTQFGGVAVNTGTGASGTGTPRVTVSNDSAVQIWDGTNTATVKAAATSAAPSTDKSLVVQVLAQGNNPCMGFFGGNVFTTISGTTSGTSATQIVALSAGKKIWVCSELFVSTSGTTPTISLVYGTGTNCATGQTVLIPALALSATAGTPINLVGTFITASANALCYLQTGTTPVASYTITYAQL